MAFVDLMPPGNFLSHHNSTGLVISSDGVPIFKSSKGSIWPVYLMCTSIPPHKWTRAENLVFASLWFGPTKPNTCLNPFCHKYQPWRKELKCIRIHQHQLLFEQSLKWQFLIHLQRLLLPTQSSIMENLVALLLR